MRLNRNELVSRKFYFTRVVGNPVSARGAYVYPLAVKAVDSLDSLVEALEALGPCLKSFPSSPRRQRVL